MAGWGRVLKEKYLKEYCVSIVDINECRNNYLVHNAIQKGVPSISYFKQKVDEQIGLVYNGINICVGGKKSKYCQVRFMLKNLFQLYFKLIIKDQN